MDKSFFQISLFNVHDAQKVAEQRLKDALVLIDTGKAQHANGAFYLLGYVLEILLKTELVKQYPGMAVKASAPPGKLRDLIWRDHDWLKIFDHNSLGQVQAALKPRESIDKKPHLRHLREIGGLWTIEIRYSTAKIKLNQVKSMAKWVAGIKEVLQ
jgi:hypothetical protein